MRGAPFDVTTIHTDLAGDPTAAVPGFPGAQFSSFDRPYGSPNGNWILTADTDLTTGFDEVLLVNDVVQLFEGDAASWAPGESVGFLDTQLCINDAGNWVFATNTDGATRADEYIVQSITGVLSAAAQEGGAIPGLTPPLSVPASTWGTTLDSPVIASDGTVGFSSDTIGGPPTTENDILVLGTALLAQEGVTQPPGQLGTEFWENFDSSDFWIDAGGTHWLAQGDLTGSTVSDDVVVVDGTVVLQEDVIIPGSGFTDPIDGSGIVGVHMDAGGNWFARGNNDTTEQDWVVRNGSVIATLGDPIFVGATEVWDDTDFADCFFLHVGNSGGDWVIGGVTNAASDANGVLVANGTVVVAREGEPIDIDGNGLFDDNANFSTFGSDDAFLSEDRMLYVVATMRDDAGASIGDAFVAIDLSALGTAPNDDCGGAITVTDGSPAASFDTTDTTFDGNGTCMGSPNIWYLYTATCTGTATIDLCGSSYDTTLAVYDGFTCDPLGAELGCNDDSCGLQSSLDVPVTAGDELLIEVGGYASSVGAGVLNIVCVANAGEIDVDPLSLAATQPPDTVTMQPLTINNIGAADLTWQINEDGGPPPTELVDWFEDFDSYATGSQLHGQGGWKGWGNDPLAGALTSSTFSLSAPNSVDIVGASDLVHEYSGSTNGFWVFTAWQYIPTGFTGETYFVMLNQYDDAGATNNWSTQVRFTSTGNQVIADMAGAGPPLPLVLDSWVELRVEIDLVNDTQEFYYNNQLLSQGSWTAGISGGGSLNVGAVDLFANAASSVYYDDMSLVEQQIPCLVPSDIAWLSADPISGTIPVASGQVVDVTFDSTGLTNGTYTANLCVESNDPDPGPGNGTDLVVVPVSLTVEVVVLPPDVGVDPTSMASSLLVGTMETQVLTISNTGGSDLFWDLFEEPAESLPAPPPDQPPVTRFDSQAALDTEQSGIEESEAQDLGPRDPAAAARARRLLLGAGLLLVPESTNDRVMAFDATTGNLVDPDFIPADPDHLSTPIHAILSASGDSILVSDQLDDVVQEYALDGTYVGVFAPAGGPNTAILDNIRGISLRPNGNLLVTVGGGANDDAVAEFDTAGNYLGNFVANGSGGLDSPFDVTWIVNWMVGGITSDAIHMYDDTGAYLSNLAPIDSFPEQIAGAVNGNILAANFSGAQEGIVEFTPAGGVVGIYDPASLGGYRGVYELPNGNLLVTNGAGVHEIDRSGNLVETKISGVSGRFIEPVSPQASCSNLADVPWLSANPITGTINAGSSTPVDVTFDATVVPVGTYDASLCLFSSDPDEPVIQVPVQMEVVIPVELMNITIE